MEIQPRGLHHRAGRWLRWRVGYGLSRVGEVCGIHWLTYNPLHFRSFHDHAVRNAPGVVSCIRDLFPEAKAILDVGAGSGAFAAEFMRRNVKVVACEHSPAGRRMAKEQGVDIRPFDLSVNPPAQIPEKFDIAYCFEVAEHLPPAMGDGLVRFLATTAPLVIFSAAHPGQKGTGHINEQPRGYWIQRFEANGMRHRQDLTTALSAAFGRQELSPWFAANVLVMEATKAR